MTKTYYTEDHEYIRVEDSAGAAGKTGIVGISDHAQKALGDIVYVELPKVGAKLAKGGQAGVVESVKSASEVYSPVSGEVLEVNTGLSGDPAVINQDPLGKGWFYKVKVANDGELGALKDEAAYKAYVEGLG